MTNTDALIERLRALRKLTNDRASSMRFVPNPDGPAAADLITSQQARIAELEGGLQAVDEELWSVSSKQPKREPRAFTNALKRVENIIRAALKGEPKP